MSKKEIYKTVREQSESLLIEKKSKFIANVKPVDNEQDALDFLNEMRSKYSDARHNVYAYVIDENNIFRYSDDGEPGGTAGLPMMDVLKNAGAVNCCVVVVRYFGGVLLGTGGLVRAYTLGCKIALEAAGLVRMELSDVLRCRISYPLWNSVQYAVQKLPVQLGDTVYAEDVAFVLIVRKKDSEATVLQLRNLSDGKMTCEPVSEEYKAWDL